MDVIDILKLWLTANGYDGLYNDECGCSIKELAPCSGIGHDCSPGYLHPGGDGFCFYIQPGKFNDTPPQGEKETK